MTTQSKILIALAIVAVLLGAMVLVFAVMCWPVIAGTDMAFLVAQYDPNGDPGYQEYRTYANLYHVAKSIGAQRNRQGMQFLWTVGLSLLAVGGILLAWSIDRERLSRRMGRRKPQ
jgi:hypothetical protein